MKRTLTRIAVLLSGALVAPAVSWQEVSAEVSARDALIASYQKEFWRVPPAIEYSGDVDACTAGTTSSAWQESVIQRVNWYRALAGSPSVRVDTTNHQAAMQAALIQAAEGRLSHNPGSEWRCWTKQGADAAGASNIALGTEGTSSVDAYIDEDDVDDTAVGHRSWLLRPDLEAVATGDVPGWGGFSANALWVTGNIKPGRSGTSAHTTWPPAGLVPDAVVSSRWSFDPRSPGASFAGASVAMTGPRGVVDVRIVHAGAWLVWEPAVSMDVSVDTTYQVTVSGGSGWPGGVASYSVTLVPVNEAPMLTGVFSMDAPWCASSVMPLAVVWASDEGAMSFSLVDGEGALDNGMFSMRDGALYPAVELSHEAAMYQVRVRAQDSDGAVAERVVRFSVRTPAENGGVCPVRNLRVEPLSATAARVAWDTPAWDTPGVVHRVFAADGMPACKRETATSCVVTGLARGVTYKIFVRSSLGSASVMSAFVSHTAGGAATYRRSTKVQLALVMSVPTGTKTYRSTGRCVLSSDRKVVVFSKTPGRCTISVTGRIRRNGRTVVTNRVVQLTVS